MESIFIKQGIVIRVLLEKWRNYGIIDEKMPDLGRNDLQRNAGEKKKCLSNGHKSISFH